MVGLCGVLGSRDHPIGPLLDGVTWGAREATTSYRDDQVAIAGSFHESLVDDPPAVAETTDVRIWVWGDVYGHGSGEYYAPRDGSRDGSAAYCARLFDTYGLGFVSDLNGDFAIAIHDRDAGTFSVATDRVATRPIYYTRLGPDSLVFASNLQALAGHPGVDARFDPDFLLEYLQLRRVFGRTTPLEGIREVAPATVATIDLDDLSADCRSYWRPAYDPDDRSLSSFSEEFADTLSTVLSEWMDDDRDYGLLLSGGTDSRAVQAAIDESVTAFHVADWESREVRVARRAAETHGDDFRLLERDAASEARALERNPPLSNFSGWFDQAYFTGFEDKIRDEVDCLVSGLYADMLFADGPFWSPRVPLGPLGSVSLPVRPRLDSLDDYAAMQAGEAIEPYPCGSSTRPVQAVIRDNLSRCNGHVESHGVRYPSFDELVLYGDFYPMGADTDAIFSRSLMHMAPYRTPFLDNRLLDLSQRVPVAARIRQPIVERGVERLDPDLAAIPHARTGVPLDRSFGRQYLGGLLNQFRWTHLADDEPPEPHYDHRPWPDRAALLRERDFARDAIEENRGLLEALPIVSYDDAVRSYEAHLDGADNTTALYGLVTLLEMPASRAVAASLERGVDQVEASVPSGGPGGDEDARDPISPGP